MWLNALNIFEGIADKKGEIDWQIDESSLISRRAMVLTFYLLISPTYHLTLIFSSKVRMLQ